jgi:hypothetical protein
MSDATRYRTVPFVPGDLYNGDTIAMPPYPVLAGTAKWLLLALRREYEVPLAHPLTLPELVAIARRYANTTDRSITSAIKRLIAGGYLQPVASQEVP